LRKTAVEKQAYTTFFVRLLIAVSYKYAGIKKQMEQGA